MKVKKTQTRRKLKLIFRYLMRYCKKHLAVVVPLLIIFCLMLGTFIGGQKGSVIVRKNEERGIIASTEEAAEVLTEKETPKLHLGLMGVIGGIERMKQIGTQLLVKDTAGSNEEILIGAAGTGRAEYQQKRVSDSMAESGITHVSGVQFIRENQMDPEEYYTLLRIVEAEATGEDFEGKRLIANVILNRVRDERFPDTISGVVWQQEDGSAQFQPTVDGRFHEVEISEDTINAVDEALGGVDESHGALFFMARSASEEHNVNWFDSSLTRLFTHGGHEYFTISDGLQTS